MAKNIISEAKIYNKGTEKGSYIKSSKQIEIENLLAKFEEERKLKHKGIGNLETSKDIVNKVKRDLSKYKKQPTSDNLFNLVITTYHADEWIRKEKSSLDSKEAKKKYYKKLDPYYKLILACMEVLCTRAKHGVKTKRDIGISIVELIPPEKRKDKYHIMRVVTTDIDSKLCIELNINVKRLYSFQIDILESISYMLSVLEKQLKQK